MYGIVFLNNTCKIQFLDPWRLLQTDKWHIQEPVCTASAFVQRSKVAADKILLQLNILQLLFYVILQWCIFSTCLVLLMRTNQGSAKITKISKSGV